MKKVRFNYLVLAAVLIPGSVFAQTTLADSTEAVLTEQGMRNQFEQAKALYDTRQFKRALVAFEQLWRKAPTSLTLNFYLGSSALELKNYDVAMAAFDRVLILNPQHSRTRLELARLYYETGELDMANAELDIALRADLPDVVKNNVLLFKSRIAKARSRHDHAFTLVLGLNYDSNARNDIGAANSFDLPGFGGLELSGNDEVSDVGFGQTLVYNHGYDFGARGGWTLNSQLVGFNKINKDVPENDLLYFSAGATPTYVKDIYKVTFPIEFDRVFVDGEGYMSNQSIGAGFSQMLSPTQTLAADYKVRNMQYDGINDNRNAVANIYGLNYRHAIGRKPLILGAQWIYESRQQSNETANDPASLTEMTLKLDASKVLNNRWRLNGALSLRNTDYKQYDALFMNKRHDQVSKLDMGAMYQLNRQSMLSGGLGHAIHDSNQGPYTFNKTLLAFNYILRF